MTAGGEQKLFIKTPLLHSEILSQKISTPVYLKLENVQLSHSFKIRGFGNACLQNLKKGTVKGFTTFSAGNGGISLAYACNLLKVPCQVFVPNFVPERVLRKIESLNATLQMCESGKDCLIKGRALSEQDPEWVFLHPHENSDIWDGYSVMIREIQEDLPEGSVPSCIVASVGGGGLLTGILNELDRMGWNSVPVVAMETIGAHCFNKSLAAGKIVPNEPLTSVAKTLCAPFCTQKILDLSQNFNVISTALEDRLALDACLKFADDHTFLVEPAAGVSLATVYSGLLPEILGAKGFDVTSGPVVVVVCGGNDISTQILWDHARNFQLL